MEQLYKETECIVHVKRPRARNCPKDVEQNCLPMLQRNRFLCAEAMQQASSLGQKGTFKEARDVQDVVFGGASWSTGSFE